MTEAVQPAPLAGLRPRRGRVFVVLAVLVASTALIALLAGGIGENLVYYWGPKELRAAGDKAVGASIRLGGQVAPGSIRQVSGVSGLEFDVSDGTATVHVRSRGVPPQMFRESIGVVVEGTYTDAGVFESQRLMVSHGNEYRAPADPGKADVKELMRSTREIEEKPAGQ